MFILSLSQSTDDLFSMLKNELKVKKWSYIINSVSGRKNTSFSLDNGIYIKNKAEVQKQKFKPTALNAYHNKYILKNPFNSYISYRFFCDIFINLHAKPFVTIFQQ